MCWPGYSVEGGHCSPLRTDIERIGNRVSRDKTPRSINRRLGTRAPPIFKSGSLRPAIAQPRRRRRRDVNAPRRTPHSSVQRLEPPGLNRIYVIESQTGARRSQADCANLRWRCCCGLITGSSSHRTSRQPKCARLIESVQNANCRAKGEPIDRGTHPRYDIAAQEKGKTHCPHRAPV